MVRFRVRCGSWTRCVVSFVSICATFHQNPTMTTSTTTAKDVNPIHFYLNCLEAYARRRLAAQHTSIDDIRAIRIPVAPPRPIKMRAQPENIFFEISIENLKHKVKVSRIYVADFLHKTQDEVHALCSFVRSFVSPACLLAARCRRIIIKRIQHM